MENLSHFTTDYELGTLVAKIVSMACFYTNVTSEAKNTLKNAKNLDQLALKFNQSHSFLVKSQNQTLKKTVIHLNLIQPSWLSILVLLQKLEDPPLQSLDPLVIDNHVQKILEDILTGNDLLLNLEYCDITIYNTLVSKMFDALPIHVIARALVLLKKFRRRQPKVKMSADKKLVNLMKDLSLNDRRSAKHCFENGLAMDQNGFKNVLKTTVHLMSMEKGLSSTSALVS